jgi:two-component system sensor histidine kinase RegB
MPRLPAPTPAALNLRRLTLLRWIALGGQLAPVLVAIGAIGMALPLHALAVIFATLIGINLATHWRLRGERPVTEPELFAHLTLDMLGLTALLYFTGGSTNPFATLYLLPLTLTAAALPGAYTWTMAALCVASYSVLLFVYVPLPETHAGHNDFHLHVVGMWLGFLLAAGLIAWFAVRMAQTLRERDGLLAQMREQALRHERILALGTLAAGAAHELGTPLATIAVVAKELERTAPTPDANIVVLREQIARCKEILGSLTASAGHARAEGGGRLALDRYLDDLMARFGTMRPEAMVRYRGDGARPAPVVVTEQTLSQALLNVLNNAADANARDIDAEAHWTADELIFEVRDRGAGLSVAALEHAGEPFFSTRPPGTGMGLGLFLARGTVERLQGTLTLSNRADGGAVCHIRLPLATLRVSA